MIVLKKDSSDRIFSKKINEKIKEKTHEFIYFCVSYGLWLMFWVVKVISSCLFLFTIGNCYNIYIFIFAHRRTLQLARVSTIHSAGRAHRKWNTTTLAFSKQNKKETIFIICLCVKNILESVTGAALWCLYFLLQSGPGLRDMRSHSCLFLFTYSIIISSKISFRLLVL